MVLQPIANSLRQIPRQKWRFRYRALGGEAKFGISMNHKNLSFVLGGANSWCQRLGERILAIFRLRRPLRQPLTNKFSPQIICFKDYMICLNVFSPAFKQHHLMSLTLKSIDSSWILLMLLWIAFTRIPQIISILPLHRRGNQREKTTNLPPTRHTLFRKQDGRESRRKRFPHQTKAHLHQKQRCSDCRVVWLLSRESFNKNRVRFTNK